MYVVVDWLADRVASTRKFDPHGDLEGNANIELSSLVGQISVSNDVNVADAL